MTNANSECHGNAEKVQGQSKSTVLKNWVVCFLGSCFKDCHYTIMVFCTSPLKICCPSCLSRASLFLDSSSSTQALFYNLLLLKKCMYLRPSNVNLELDRNAESQPLWNWVPQVIGIHTKVWEAPLVNLPQSVPLDSLKQTQALVLFKRHKHAQPLTDQYHPAVMAPRWRIRGKWRLRGFSRFYTEN